VIADLVQHPLTAALVAVPLAHIGHWLWVFYLIPVLIVVGGIVRSTRAEKRREAEDAESAKSVATRRKKQSRR
jgi:4-hydroxybenzoate polyprenyltransferase